MPKFRFRTILYTLALAYIGYTIIFVGTPIITMRLR